MRGGERADRANIDRIQRIIVFQPFAWMSGENSVTAAIDKPEHVILGNFLTKTNATRAKNAPFIIEYDAGSDFHAFWFFDFVFQKT